MPNSPQPIYGELPKGWHLAEVQDLVSDGRAHLQTGPFGTMLHASAYTSAGTPVVAVKNIGENCLVHDELPRIDDEDNERLARYSLRSGDILFGRKGDVERRALIRPDEEGWLQGSDCIRLRILTDQVDPKFLSYVFGTRQYREWISRNAQGATMPSLNQEIIGRIPVPLPNASEQRAIAQILGALDDKIGLNWRMNETLEAMARAIFKSWFVDFDPVRAKAAGRQPFGMDAETAALFPSSFEDSPIGKIPKIWRAATLTEIFEINPPRSLRKGEATTYLDMQNMPTSGHRVLGWTRRSFVSGSKFANGDTLVARITPCLENGKTALVDFLADHEVGWGSTEFIVLRPREPVPAEFGYCLARHEEFRAHAIQNMSGSSGRQRVATSCFSQYWMAAPTEGVARAFGRTVRPFFVKARINSEEAATLAALRDTLLPKLISGEIRIKDAEKIVGEKV